MSSPLFLLTILSLTLLPTSSTDCYSTFYGEFGVSSAPTDVDCEGEGINNFFDWSPNLETELVACGEDCFNCTWQLPPSFPITDSDFGVYVELYSTDDEPTQAPQPMDGADPILYPILSTSAEVDYASFVVCHLSYWESSNNSSSTDASSVKIDVITAIEWHGMSPDQEDEAFFGGKTSSIIAVSLVSVSILAGVSMQIYRAHRRSILEQVGNNVGGPISKY